MLTTLLIIGGVFAGLVIGAVAMVALCWLGAGYAVAGKLW